MDEQTAKIVIGAGAAVGVLVWLVALQLYRKMADTPATEAIEVPISNGTPTEAINRIVASAGQLAGQAKLARPADHVFEVTQYRCHTRIEAHKSGGKTMLTAELDDSALRRMMQRILAFFVVLLMPATIVGVAAALWHFAAPSPAPAARWQAVQVVQMVHVLWPPFLIYGLWSKQRAMALDATSNLLVLAAR
jgi:hypothetical protein